MSRFRPNSILDGLAPMRAIRWRNPADRTENSARIIVENFSLLSNPTGVFQVLTEIAEAEATVTSAQVDFKDKYCQDVLPYMLLAEVWPALSPVFRGGRMSPSVGKVLDRVGLQAELGIRVPKLDDTDVWALPAIRRRPKGSTTDPDALLKPQKREDAADRLCASLDDWLGVPEIDQELTGTGRTRIHQIVGEILDNAERHSVRGSIDGDWIMAAFMARRPDEDGKTRLRCYLGFLNLGRTIAENILEAPEKVRNAAQRYAIQHARDATKQLPLLTVFALQDGVTSNAAAQAAGRGGTGLLEVVAFARDLGGLIENANSAEVCIMSGNVYLRIADPHSRHADWGPQSNRTIWFNDENDLSKPPRKDLVTSLAYKLPGTAISVGFTLDPGYLRATV